MEKEPKSPLSEHYDKIYAEDKAPFGAGKPEGFVIRASQLIPRDGKVIEFGAGQGRNSLALAELGFDVKAVETSQVGVDSMNQAASEKSLPTFRAEVSDARAEIEGQYDLIVSTFMLHHFTREEAEGFIRKIKEHTKDGGINAISTFTKEGDFSRLENASARFYPATEKLKGMYSDWEVLEYKEENARARATHPNGSPMFNISAEIVARKPKS